MFNSTFAGLEHDGSRAAPPPTAGRPAADRFREAVRGIADLRRGAAVVVRDGKQACAAAAAETLDPSLAEELRGWISGPTLALRPLEPGLPDQEQALAVRVLPATRLTTQSLRRLANPDAMRAVPMADGAIPAGARAAVVLAKLARLLPTLIAGLMDAEAIARAVAGGAVAIDAADIFALRDSSAQVIRVGEASAPLEDAARAQVVAYRHPPSGEEHIAVVIGAPTGDGSSLPPLVRLHSECFTGDVLGSLRCDCGPQLRAAIRRMAEEGAGVVLYLAQEGRGIGLLNKLRAYALQDSGMDTLDANATLGFAADERDFSVAATMLRDLGLTNVRLLTNNPAKVAALAAAGMTVERASLLVAPNGINDAYLATKAVRFGHLKE